MRARRIRAGWGIRSVIRSPFRSTSLATPARSLSRDSISGAIARPAEPHPPPGTARVETRRRAPCMLSMVWFRRRPTHTEEQLDMSKSKNPGRQQLIARLNEDLAREYQAIIAYVVYSQTLKGAQYMAIAGELEKHAGEELAHALTIAKHIDYLGGTPVATALPVKETDDAKEMLRADLENENDTIRNYRQRVGECEKLGEYGIAEDIREILRQEQEHQSDLATALGEDVPDLSASS